MYAHALPKTLICSPEELLKPPFLLTVTVNNRSLARSEEVDIEVRISDARE
jgi:hypothetical protein